MTVSAAARMRDSERRVLRRELVHRFRDPLLVAAALRFDGEAVHRRGEFQRREMDVVFVVRVVQHGVEMDLVHLRDRADVARHERIGFDELLALQQIGMAHLERLAAVADEKLGVARDRALVHAKDADLAHERVDHDFEDVREHVLRRIRRRVNRLGGGAFALQKLRRVAFGGIRHQLHEHVEQLGDARAGARRNEADRHEVALAQRLFEGRVQFGRAHFALLEVLRHQLFVDFDDLVDQRLVRFLDGGEIRLARRIEEAVDDALSAVRRQVDRQAFLAEGSLDLGDQLRQIDVFRIDLVHDDDAAEAALSRPLHHALRDHLDAVLRADHDRRGFDGGQRPDRPPDEIGQPGRVDEVNAGFAGGQVHARRVQGMLIGLFQRVEIADGAASFDAARGCDRAGAMQQRFRERRLAGRAVADERDRANHVR